MPLPSRDINHIIPFSELGFIYKPKPLYLLLRE